MTPSSPNSPVLSAQGLQRSFGAVVAAADVNIDIRRGERLCLIGSNGAGKTTFVNMITGYLKPTAGRILLQGEDITQRTPREITRRGVARSFQIPQLYLQLSVLDNMLAALHANQGSRHFLQAAHDGASIARGLDLLERFGLAAQAQRPVREAPQNWSVPRRRPSLLVALIRAWYLVVLVREAPIRISIKSLTTSGMSVSRARPSPSRSSSSVLVLRSGSETP
jgi:ABC-type branched-subunit amino acid transport system ATPase component